MRSFTWSEVWGRRLARHGLLAPFPRERLVEAVRAVCGIHAQMMPAAELSIGVRVAEVTREDVRAELWQRKGLVKTYGLRGTVHLFPADELPLWVAALRTIQVPSDERRLAEMGLKPGQVESLVAAIGEALDGQCLTREELGEEVACRVGSWALDAESPAFGGRWPRWQMAIGAAATAGLLCFGPNQGSKVTFVRPDQWLDGWAEIDGAGALRTVLRRYLSAYGPATHRDFAQWLAMPPGKARAVMQEVADELEEVDVEGYRAWLPAGESDQAAQPAQDVVRLLPHFDCYLIGCHPRDRLVPAAWSKRVLPYGGIGNLPLLVVDGVVAGIWQERRQGRNSEVRVEAFQPLSARQLQELEVAVAHIGAIAQAETTLALGAVETRPHL